MKTSDFDYHLPEALIAQHSVEPRDSSRLLVLERLAKRIEHRKFFEIGDYLKAGDLLVMNDTKVFKARLKTSLRGKNIEIFLVRPTSAGWLGLAKPRKYLIFGEEIKLGKISFKVSAMPPDGTVIFQTDATAEEVLAMTDELGEIPVPPYVKEVPTDFSKYQTAVARVTGSVAAPTAAFHFTPELIEKLKVRGIEFAFLTLHVGLGTFLPVKTENLEDHPMHAEWVSLPAETAAAINLAKAQNRRVIAVGTTTTRALEAVALQDSGQLLSYSGEVNIFIRPGFEFEIIDGLITNFHLPKSTLLALVSAFAGRERILAAYEDAIQLGYRFYSFGDAMLIY